MNKKNNLFGESSKKNQEELIMEDVKPKFEDPLDDNNIKRKNSNKIEEIKINDKPSPNKELKSLENNFKGKIYPYQEIEHSNFEKEIEKYEIRDDSEITVSDPVKKEGFKSYVVYTVKAKYLKDPVLRRYNDFHILRTKLVERWPGVYIPNIPPKKIVVILKFIKGNLESKIVSYRMKILDRFFSRICNFKFLESSDEVITFLSGSSDIEKV